MSTNHFSRQAPDYAKYRPSYPEALFSWLVDRAPGRELVWDVGCGNGQAAVPLAAHFRRVVATDLSIAQIDQAKHHPRIEYRAAPCDASGLPDACCDLVTVAQAIHWFDFDKFYAEVLTPWWPPERRWVELGYIGMPFPFAVLPAPTFEIRLHWTLADLLNYIGTWSAVQRCSTETGSDPTPELFARLRPYWGEPATTREIVWPIALLAGHA